MRRMLSFLAALILALTACSACFAEENAADSKTLLRDAVIYTMPLMMVKATEIKVTNAETAGYTQAPINQLVQVPVLADAAAKDVVTPNVDTLYTQAFLDLYQDAVIISLPKADRFCIMQFMDAYTNTISIIDCMTLAEGGESFILTGPYWQGEIPEGMTQIKSPTCMVWLLGRTICADTLDAVAARAVQKKMDMYTLTAYLNGTTADKPKGEFVEAENFIPRNFVISRTMEQYFDLANKLMLLNPPAAADAQAVAAFAAIGVGPGMDFDPTIFGSEAEVAALWQETMQAVFTQATIASARFRKANGPWLMAGDPIADWGTEYGYRAGVALVALGANPTYMAVYPNATTDSEGETLNGANRYIIHIDADAFPPVYENGFWSITAYNSYNYLIGNELNRYAIKNNTPYVLNEDGSLDIYVQAKKPADEKQQANWLPISEGDFQLYLRVYNPTEEVLNNTWVMPSILKNTAEEPDVVAEEPAEEQAPIYLALGDSISTGYGLAEGQKGFADIVAEEMGYTLINRAINGNTSMGILAQMKDPLVLADVKQADVITITCGGNDLMGMLFQAIADAYNTAVPPILAIKAENVPAIMSAEGDPRQQALMMAAKTVLEGNAEMGIEPIIAGEAIKTALTAYMNNMAAVITTIRMMNADATIVVTTQYNPYAVFGGAYESLSAGVDLGVQALSKVIADYSTVVGYRVAGVYGAFAASAENLCNATMEPLNVDVHPNAAGHAVIAQCVLDALKAE